MRSFDSSLSASKRTQLTCGQHLTSIGQMVDYPAAHDMALDPEKLTPEHIESFLADLTEDQVASL